MSKPREILMPFVDDLVLAIMSGRKTNTRRVLKPQPQPFVGRMVVCGRKTFSENEAQNHVWNLPYQVGDRIGVRESAKVEAIGTRWETPQTQLCKVKLRYRADDSISDWIDFPSRLKPMSIGQSCPNGIFREGVRTWLEVTGVRIERLNEISEADAIAEGCDGFETPRHHEEGYESYTSPREHYAQLWESIYGEDSFDDKWVIVTEFKVLNKGERA